MATPGVVWLERAQERDQVRFFLGRQDQAEAAFVETHGFQQRLCGAVMEVRRACGETPQDRSLDSAHVVKFAIDQSLAEIRRGFAVARSSRRVCGTLQFALRN